MSEIFSDVKDRLKKIPPWGYGVMAGGVLLLVVLSKRGGGQTVYSVNPANETGPGTGGTVDNSGMIGSLQDLISRLSDQIADSNGRMQDLYSNLEGKLVERNDQLLWGVKDMQEQIGNLKKPDSSIPQTSIPTNPVNTGSALSEKESRFLRQIGSFDTPSTAQLQTLGSIGAKSNVTFNTSGLSEKEQRFIRDAQAIINSGGSLSTAQQQTYGSLISKAGTIIP